MPDEYSFAYKRLGETVIESFDSLEQALIRSVEVLHRRWGVSVSIRHRGALLFDQESLFNDWLQSLQG